MSFGMIVLLLVLAGAVATLPRWTHSRSWGYGPSSGLGLVFVALLLMAMAGRI